MWPGVLIKTHDPYTQPGALAKASMIYVTGFDHAASDRDAVDSYWRTVVKVTARKHRVRSKRQSTHIYVSCERKAEVLPKTRCDMRMPGYTAEIALELNTKRWNYSSSFVEMQGNDVIFPQQFNDFDLLRCLLRGGGAMCLVIYAMP